MIIRFCLSIASKSASAYKELRPSNVLTLPTLRTLRDYKNANQPTTGFNMKVFEKLCKTAEILQRFQRFVVLSFDGMKIQQNLAFDKHSRELIEHVDLGSPERNFSTFDIEDDLATHVLCTWNSIGPEICIGVFCHKKYLFISNHVLILGSNFDFRIYL